MPVVIAVTGVSNSGKTTLIERLIPELKARGHRIGTLKHSGQDFEIDRPGKDTWRHRAAGAEVVAITGPRQLAMIRQVESLPDPRELLATTFSDMDLVLIEGFADVGFPMLEVVRAGNSLQPVSHPERLIGLVTDQDLASLGVPCYGLEAIDAIVDRLVEIMAHG